MGSHMKELELRYNGPIPKWLKREALRQDRREEALKVLKDNRATNQQRTIAMQILAQLKE